MSEKAFIEALEIYKELAKTNPSVYNPDIAMTFNNLANLYKRVNKLKEAEEAFIEALNIRRELVKANPSAYSHDLADILNDLAFY